MTLQQYYASLGLPEEAWHVGPEHPAIEELGLEVLATTRGARILEVGVQSGGFAVPLILASFRQAGFSYKGVDNLEYTNAVPLKLISEYLVREGATDNIEFFEGDSSVVLQAAAPRSFDLILLDHYKPKYPIDLYVVCARDLLAPGGAVVLHDVLTHAAPDWKVCARVCRAFGYTWTIDSNVSQGAAIVRRGPTASPSTLLSGLVGLEVKARWRAHAAILRCRRSAGRRLRALGLRR